MSNLLRLLVHEPTKALILILLLMMPALSQDQENELKYKVTHRVNAHGDEFNALSKSPDGQRLFVGTEKGDVIIWNVTLERIERRLRQPSAVHLISALSDPNFVIASGSNHYEPRRALVRKWNVETGAFVDLTGLDPNSFPSAITADGKLVAVGTVGGTVQVWDWTTEKTVATWKVSEVPLSLALIQRTLYMVSVSQAAIASDAEISENAITKFNLDDPEKRPTEFLKVPGRSWTAVAASPDRRLLSATYAVSGEGVRTLLFRLRSKSPVGNFSASASVWIDSTKLLLFNWLDPSELVAVPIKGEALSLGKIERMQADTDGRAFELSGQVTSADGKKAWASYRKGPGLLEFSLAAKKIRTLIGGPSGAYGLSVLEDDQDGLVLTGGADGYVRLWKLSDLSLKREYEVAPAGHLVVAVHLVRNGQQAVVRGMRIRKASESSDQIVTSWIQLLDLETGKSKKLLDLKWSQAGTALIGNQLLYPDLNRMKLQTIDSGQPIREFTAKSPIVRSAVSSNGKWLATLDSEQILSAFQIETGNQIISKSAAGNEGPLVITNDGRYICQVDYEGKLNQWDLQTGRMSEIRLTRLHDMHTRADFITLANGDKWLVTAGNHGDVGIFDRATGTLVSYTQTSSAGFYVEKVWVGGDRMITTTDTGIMFSGKLIK